MREVGGGRNVGDTYGGWERDGDGGEGWREESG